MRAETEHSAGIEESERELEELTKQNYQLNEMIRLAREEREELDKNKEMMEKHLIEHDLVDLQNKYKLLQEELVRITELYDLFHNPEYIIKRFSTSEPVVLFHFLKLLHNGVLEKKNKPL
jgi:predicted nuclease with TOPRIM domain